MLAGRCTNFFFRCKYGLLRASNHSAALTLIPFHHTLSRRGDRCRQLTFHPFSGPSYQQACGTPALRCVNHLVMDRWCTSLAPEDPLSTDHSRPTDPPATEHAHKSPTCSGCGSLLQCTHVDRQGYIPRERLEGVDRSLVNRRLANSALDDGAVDGKEDGAVDGREDGAVDGREDGAVDGKEDGAEDGREDGAVYVREDGAVDGREDGAVDGREVDGRDGAEDGREEVCDGSDGGTQKTSPLTCKRCFSLKHYNTALNVTLQADDYLRHLSHLCDKRALILLVVDVIDFPGSLFPSLHTLISTTSRVLVVANKIDLLPKDTNMNRLKGSILDECEHSGLDGSNVSGVVFTSVRSGEGLDNLATSVLEKWGNRGDVYLLGCTNVGKSSLFNHLLQTLCGARPGELDVDCGLGAPAATISHWPGTTLGLLSFPIMSVGKRKRLLAQQLRARGVGLQGGEGEREPTLASLRQQGMKEPPQNRFWLHDTPGAINEAQLINLLTTKELNLALPKKPLCPRTFILKPGQCLLLGGLARLDYLDGLVSAYFTVFAAPYLPVHITNVEKADAVWTRNLGTPQLKIPCGDSERLAQFPGLQPQLVSLTGAGWRCSAADVVLSSAGWVAITVGQGKEVSLMAHTPGGRGVHCRQPSMWPSAVNERGKRSRRRGHRATFTGK